MVQSTARSPVQQEYDVIMVGSGAGGGMATNRLANANLDETDPDLQPGIRFFSFMRDLTLTGYYTTESGFRDLGYQGNTPNVWDGVPQEELVKHGMSYEQEWLEKCVDQSRRDITTEWEDDMSSIT